MVIIASPSPSPPATASAVPAPVAQPSVVPRRRAREPAGCTGPWLDRETGNGKGWRWWLYQEKSRDWTWLQQMKHLFIYVCLTVSRDKTWIWPPKLASWPMNWDVSYQQTWRWHGFWPEFIWQNAGILSKITIFRNFFVSKNQDM